MKCALVTGSSRGIGKAIAIQLAKDHNLHILINFSSNLKAAQETLKIIQENNGSGELINFNVADSNAVNSAITEWFEKTQKNTLKFLLTMLVLQKIIYFHG